MSGRNIVPHSTPARNGQRLDNLKKMAAIIRQALTGSIDPDPIEKFQNALRDVFAEGQR